MLDKQFEEIAILLESEDLKKYSGDAFWDFIQAIVSKDPFLGISSMENIKNLICHMPTVIFWDKMRRFLFGTYKNFSEQVTMAEKFNRDNDKYREFIKKLIYLINEMDEDVKVDYYASLTRCLLLQGIENHLYFRLAKFLVQCTSYELEFIKNCNDDIKLENTAMVSILYQYGLFEQKENNDAAKKVYSLSSFGKALKSCCLNFEEDSRQNYFSYNLLEPLDITETATDDDIDQIINGTYAS